MMAEYDPNDPFGELEADRDAEIDARHEIAVNESWKLRNGVAHISHSTLRMTPAMAAGVSGTQWTVADLLRAAA